MLTLVIGGISLAVLLHNLAPYGALATAGELTPGGQRRATLACAVMQVLLSLAGLGLGFLLQRRFGSSLGWTGITLVTGAGLWDLFTPADYAASRLPVAANEGYAGPVAADGAAPPGRLWLAATLLGLDNLVIGLGLPITFASQWPGHNLLAALFLVLAALLPAMAGQRWREPGPWAVRAPRLGTYLLLILLAAFATLGGAR